MDASEVANEGEVAERTIGTSAVEVTDEGADESLTRVRLQKVLSKLLIGVRSLIARNGGFSLSMDNGHVGSISLDSALPHPHMKPTRLSVARKHHARGKGTGEVSNTNTSCPK
ncbi:hypothetical protein GW17_00017324 [Ensete ventricosum]|nr:hypothetical protein GW17_00017324 [Ensete ventricosum]